MACRHGSRRGFTESGDCRDCDAVGVVPPVTAFKRPRRADHVDEDEDSLAATRRMERIHHYKRED